MGSVKEMGRERRKTSNKLIPAETQPSGGGIMEGVGGGRWLGSGRGICTGQARCLHEFLGGEENGNEPKADLLDGWGYQC